MEDQVSCICEEHYDNFLHCPHCFNRLKKAEEIKAENKRLMEEVQQRQNYLKSVLGKINILEERMRVLSNKTEKTDPFRWSENVENDLLSKDLPSNFFNLCKDPELAMSFLVQSGTIPKTRKCDKCFTDSGAPDMKLENYGALGFSFRCPQCFAKSSVKEHTFWSRCQLSIEKILLFVFLWVLYVKDADVASLLDSTASHIASLSRKLRKLTCKDFLDNIPKFTGVVEIDEQNFVKRKIEIGKGKTPAK